MQFEKKRLNLHFEGFCILQMQLGIKTNFVNQGVCDWKDQQIKAESFIGILFVRIYVNIFLKVFLLISISCSEMGYGDEIHCNYSLKKRIINTSEEAFRVVLFN